MSLRVQKGNIGSSHRIFANVLRHQCQRTLCAHFEDVASFERMAICGGQDMKTGWMANIVGRKSGSTETCGLLMLQNLYTGQTVKHCYSLRVTHFTEIKKWCGRRGKEKYKRGSLLHNRLIFTLCKGLWSVTYPQFTCKGINAMNSGLMK